MIYRVIGLMSGSSLDGIDIVFTELEERAGKWVFEIIAADCVPYGHEWFEKLQQATRLNAYEYLLLHAAYGKFTGEIVNKFIDKHDLHHKVQLIASHGHTVFHKPSLGMTAQLGDGATIAATTGINVVSDLRAMDVALGGQGAPIVPVGEKLLLPEYGYYLNLGGIANISANISDQYIAFDICPANRVLNMLAAKEGKEYDNGGSMAQSGLLNTALLTQLNNQSYYTQAYPKSLANNFGTDILFPLIEVSGLPAIDALRTYTEHIVQQIVHAVNSLQIAASKQQMLVTGGGAFNNFLIKRLKESLNVFNIEVIVPDENLVKYKEALIMALLGVLRWREEDTVMQSVTGASRNSIGGAVWIGQEA
ncbi:anhydro-N-acetylmuramic acid kinase [Panacibacter ginsenosidivorans]|uniref:Anhydro-N-acetylmuramic acid kinase n=1 Tax=Panacibacter ginsenosidivorans TaxID=1813871 RepID=A0A5B8V4H0_9BACT|nr:anhydro-N-acetylmuramic acid kinase [Panacibacter ginsenosidivorans]QEC65925.1 anhydro-N-acetylmuramic acid kinase [Panacibacter ginsenosidivorans]